MKFSEVKRPLFRGQKIAVKRINMYPVHSGFIVSSLMLSAPFARRFEELPPGHPDTPLLQSCSYQRGDTLKIDIPPATYGKERFTIAYMPFEAVVGTRNIIDHQL